VAATASELRARGHRWAASWAVVRELGPACYYARVGQRRGDVKGWAGRLGWLAQAEQAEPARPSSSSFLSFFHFFSIV